MEQDTKGMTGPIGPKGAEGVTGVASPPGTGNGADIEPIQEAQEQREARERAETDRDLIRRAAGPEGDGKNGDLDIPEQITALDWFLSDAPAPVEYTFDINIGTPRDQRWIKWTIQAVDVDMLRRIRKEAEGPRRARRQRQPGEPMEVDQQEMSARIVVAGTIDPDLREVARMKGAPDHPDPDVPAIQILKHRFRHKPGLIDQLSLEVMSLSGYDDEDIREHMAGKA
jgi:hypothetical protein